jgi:hypothetical protein
VHQGPKVGHGSFHLAGDDLPGEVEGDGEADLDRAVRQLAYNPE